MRYQDLSDEELQAKAEAAGVKRAGSLTREQLIAKLAEKGDTGESKGKSSDFVTPRPEQGNEPIAADAEEREPAKDNQPQSEYPPADGEQADQSSRGGTGGVTTTEATTPTP